MGEDNVRRIAETLVGLAHAGMKPDELFRAARERHPDASKKVIVRAAFRALVDGAGGHPERAALIHGMATGKGAILSGD